MKIVNKKKICLIVIGMLAGFCMISRAEAFRRLPYHALDDNALCVTCERVPGWPPSDLPMMTLTVKTEPDYLSAAVEMSAQRWNREGDSFFTFKIKSDENVKTVFDGKNSIKIGNYAGICQGGVLGLSIPQPGIFPPWDRRTDKDPDGKKYYPINERDLVICEGWNWYSGSESGIGGNQIDLVAVLMHELGHHLGLGHSNINGNPRSQEECRSLNDTGAVMDTCVLDYGTIRRHLLDRDSSDIIVQGDLQGIQYIYGKFDNGLLDDDGDGAINKDDNCRQTPNADQSDIDRDGEGDMCDDDIDGDGLDNEEEEGIGTNKYKEDTDGDGLTDYEEYIVYGTDPLDTDTDDDGLSDYDEIHMGNDPLKKDNPALMIILNFILDDSYVPTSPVQKKMRIIGEDLYIRPRLYRFEITE